MYFWVEFAEKISKNKPILNPLGQHFPQRELTRMSEIVYTTVKTHE